MRQTPFGWGCNNHASQRKSLHASSLQTLDLATSNFDLLRRLPSICDIVSLSSFLPSGVWAHLLRPALVLQRRTMLGFSLLWPVAHRMAPKPCVCAPFSGASPARRTPQTRKPESFQSEAPRLQKASGAKSCHAPFRCKIASFHRRL